MKAGRNDAGVVPGAIELIEESIHLLREAPKAVLAVYFAGCALFVLGFLFFWAYVTWFTPPLAMMAWSACGLTLLFAVMKTAQADFCQRLMAIRLDAAPPGYSLRRLAGIAAGQMRIHAWGLIVLPIVTVLLIPFGWVYAYYQNASVLSAEEDAHRLASEQAKIWPAQNHLGLLLIFVLFLAALVNIAGVFLGIPWFANKVLGIDSTFGISGWGSANSTFFASVVCLSWLATDPVVKAFYVLRVFYGRARTTGEDLRVELQKARAAPGLRRLAAMIILLCACSVAAPMARCAEAPAARAAVSPEKLDASIDEVMAGRDFQWRLRQPAAAEDSQADGPIKSFVRKGFAIMRAMGDSLGRLWKRIARWFDDIFPSTNPAENKSAAASAGTSALRVLLYLFAAAIVVFVGVVVYLMATRGRAERRPAIAAKEVAPASPDLADESSHAGQLATEEWIELARTQLARGEWRLGLRALYLATLARLAADGLVSLAKSKTNLDYEREVRRRSLGRHEIPELFARRRSVFEDVWYGQLAPDESMTRAWLSEMEAVRQR